MEPSPTTGLANSTPPSSGWSGVLKPMRLWSGVRVGRTGGTLVLARSAYNDHPAGPVACLVPDGADPAATDQDRQITEALPGALLGTARHAGCHRSFTRSGRTST